MEIGITPWHLNRIVQSFVTEGRLRRLSPENHRLQTFIVNDPVEFLRSRNDTAGITDVNNALEAFKGVPRIGRGKEIQDQIRARRELEEKTSEWLQDLDEEEDGPGPSDTNNNDGPVGEPGPSSDSQ